MKKSKTKTAPFSGSQRTNIRMSKLSRMLQSSAAETNWDGMVKLLFRFDPHSGRNLAMRKLLSRRKKLTRSGTKELSYSIEDFQYVLFLMLIISVAEKQTQELYQHQYAKRCEQISKSYGLADDEYWPLGEVPEEWQRLNAEFEQHALRILLNTLNDYQQHEIAKLVEVGGVEQLFTIINSVKSQFLEVLKDSRLSMPHTLSQRGSIPETLQSSVRRRS